MKLQLKSGYWDVREKQTNGQTLLSIYEKNSSWKPKKQQSQPK